MMKLRKFVTVPLFPLLILVAIGYLGYFSLSLNAQGVLDPKALAEADAKGYAAKQAKELFSSIDVEDIAYPDNKQGCGMKSAMFLAMSSHYTSGSSVGEIATNKMFEPLVKSVYNKIKKYGLEEATLNNMREYQDCIATAKPHKDAGREYDLSLKHGACGQLNTALLDALEAIKKRKSLSRIVQKYEREDVDFTGTPYESFPDPIILFIGKLYEASKNSEYKDVVVMGSGLSVACYG